MTNAVSDLPAIITAATGYSAPEILVRIEETIWRDIFRTADLTWASADQIAEAAKLAVRVLGMRAAVTKRPG